ncbi:hypothetical protein [Halegenticoccus tardaugens]|uniref:hypothetical protein n=1 Tax=Halegenticoccus tardaugens TaxID=2071624 RepID=UPI00100A9A72|nr:hypothetical protein [Halegenticoccus tardaugens]
MGFSVSGSAAIVFAGMFISLGILYPAVSNGFERVDDARADASDRELGLKNTDFEITDAEYDSDNGTLTVVAENTGATELAVNDTDVLIDGEYRTAFDARTVDGDAETDLWLPDESLRAEISTGEEPDRVTVVSAHGVSRSEAI